MARTRSKRQEQLQQAVMMPVDWLEERSGLVGGIKYFLFRKVPAETNWFHTLGSATLTAFLVQAVTGVILAMESDDLLQLGELADEARRRRGGTDEVYFVQNLYLNQTNVCRVKCKFCAFAVTQKQDDAYTFTPAEMVEDAVAQRELSRYTEIHMFAGRGKRCSRASPRSGPTRTSSGRSFDGTGTRAIGFPPEGRSCRPPGSAARISSPRGSSGTG